MTRARASLAHGLLLAGVAAGTTWVATFSWRGFTATSGTYLGALLVLGAVVAATGALTRWARLPGAVVVLLQVLVSGMLACLMLTGSPVPVGAAWDELVGAFDAAVTTSQNFAAPVPDNVPGVHPLLVAGGLACMLLVDLLACTLRRVPLAGLPLLTVYSVPVSLLDSTISWWVFAATAGGFLTMLFLHESEQVARWGRPLGQPVDVDDVLHVRASAVKTSAGTIGGVATALAIVVPLAIPTLDVNVFDFGPGTGGDTEITVVNPVADLRRDLKRSEDVALLQVATDDPKPDYLRISVLTRFSDNEWSSGDREVPVENLPNGAMPPLQGVLPSVPRTSYDYQVSIGDGFESTWLPTQAPISSITSTGDWRFDPVTMDFISSEKGLTTAGADYQMTAVELDYDAAELAASGPAINEDTQRFLELPTSLPPLVSNLAFGVTEDAPTKFEKAQALQQWFREDGGFEYDLARSPNGNGVDDLEAFLDEEDGRVGYCEQFAASMAVMARVLDIPARVAIGFLSPEPLGSGVFEYSSHDLHAWPELYFPGAGWVLFEPTPSDRASTVPGYTTADVPVNNPSINPSSSASDDVPDRTTESASASADPKPEASSGASGGGSSFPWLPVLGSLAGLVLLAAIALTPRQLRRRLRERRLAGGAEEAWAELRATAVDLGLRWPRSRSPRETRDWLVDQFGAPDEGDLERPARGADRAPEAVAAVGRVVDRLERQRYSRGHEVAEGELGADVGACIEALGGGATPRTRRRAEWWPRSLLRPERRAAAAAAADAEPVSGGVVEQIG